MSKCFAYKGNASNLIPILVRWGEEYKLEKYGLSFRHDKAFSLLVNIITDENSDLIVLEKDNVICGFIAVESFESPIGNETICEESLLYILPEHRGIAGKMLINAATDWGKNKGCDLFKINVAKLASDKYEKTCKLYEKLGFDIIESTYIKRC